MIRRIQRKQLVLDWPAISLVTFALFIAFFFGLLASLGSKLLDFLMLGGLCSLAIVAIRPFPMVAGQAILSCLVVGQLIFFARINQALWIPYGLGLLLFFRIPDAYLQSPFSQNRTLPIPLMVPILAFITLTIFSAFLNGTAPLQAIVGGKNLIALWSIFIIIALFAVTSSQVEQIIRWLIPLALLQVPFVLYQFFFVASNRSTQGGTAGVAWDAITGSFGGDPLGGGASGVMAFALISAMLLVIALWRQGRINKALASAVLICSLICIMLAEVKAVLVLFPVGLFILFFHELVRRPTRLILAAFISALFVIAILYAYENVHYATSGRASDSFANMLDRAFGYSLDTTLINFKTGEMGRMAAFVLWWQEGFLPDIIKGLFGYGPGASRASNVAYGEIAQKYAFRIDRSAATQMLWEIGLIGFMIFSWVVLKAAYMALSLLKRIDRDAVERPYLQTSSAMLVMILLMSAYGKDLLEVPALNFFAMIALGYVAQMVTRRHPLVAREFRGNV